MDSQADGEPSVSTQLRRLTLELQEAVRLHDRGRLNSLVAEEFALAGSVSLGALDKQRWIDAATRVRWISFELLDAEANVHDDVATVVHRLRQTVASGDQDISSTWVTVDTWWRSDERWQLAGRCARRRADDV